MKRLKLLILIFLLPAVSIGQQLCGDFCGVCGELIKTYTGMPYVEEGDLIKLNLTLCEGFVIKINTLNKQPMIDLLENKYGNTICNNIDSCNLFLTTDISTIAMFGLNSMEPKNFEYTVTSTGDQKVYILQKDDIDCKVFELNITPEVNDIAFEIKLDEDNNPIEETIQICPNDKPTVNVIFNSGENENDYSYQWIKNDLDSIGAELSIKIDTIGNYKVVVTSNEGQCFAEKEFTVENKDGDLSVSFANLMSAAVGKNDTIDICINNELKLRAEIKKSGELLNLTYPIFNWSLDTTVNAGILNISFPNAEIINSTLTISASNLNCPSYSYNVPVIEAIAPPTITLAEIKIENPGACNETGNISVELNTDTTNIKYQLNINDDNIFVKKQSSNLFERIPIGKNYSIIIYNEACTDTSEIFNVVFQNETKADIKLTNFTLGNEEIDISDGVCVGTEVKFEILNTDSISMPTWTYMDETESNNSINYVVNDSNDSLKVNLSYKVSGCLADTSIVIGINQLPIPTIALTIDDNIVIENNTICKGETFTLNTGDETYNSYEWELSGTTSTKSAIDYTTTESGSIAYSLIVEDDNGCKNKQVTGDITVLDNEESAVIIKQIYPPNTDGLTNTFCKGSKAIYSYEGEGDYEFGITPTNKNRKIEHKELKNIVIVEWNTAGQLTLEAGNSETNRCAGNAKLINVEMDDEAPVGDIELFGNSSTLVVNQQNENTEFQWFVIDNENDLIYIPFDSTANERILDCETEHTTFGFDCSFFKDTTNKTKVVGVELTEGNCKNLIFYNEQDVLALSTNDFVMNNNFFNIHPNANTGEFYVTFNSIKPQNQYNFFIYNITGQAIYNTKITQTSSNFVKIDNALPGYYIAVVENGQQHIAQQKLFIY